MTNQQTVLEATSITYYSRLDEDAFFGWLSKIEAVEEFKGSGKTLFIKVNPNHIDQAAMNDLIGLFFRYGVDLAQLTPLIRPQFEEWARDTDMYWHEAMFGSDQRKHHDTRQNKRGGSSMNVWPESR